MAAQATQQQRVLLHRQSCMTALFCSGKRITAPHGTHLRIAGQRRQELRQPLRPILRRVRQKPLQLRAVQISRRSHVARGQRKTCRHRHRHSGSCEYSEASEMKIAFEGKLRLESSRVESPSNHGWKCHGFAFSSTLNTVPGWAAMYVCCPVSRRVRELLGQHLFHPMKSNGSIHTYIQSSPSRNGIQSR